MTTKARTHAIRIVSVEAGKSFVLEAAPIPLTKFWFQCDIVPDGAGTCTISQGVTIKGALAPLFGPMMGNRIAETFTPLLKGLATQAEKDSNAPGS
jgi:hypothetical protein